MSTLRLTTISNQSGSASVPSDTVINGSAKAWIFFSVTAGTPAIAAAFNVSSITDNGVGDFTFNFTNSLIDANYAFTGLGTAGGANYQIAGSSAGFGTIRSTGSLRTPFGYVSSVGGAITAQDPASASIIIFR
jgi:hypothetical protein